MNRDWLTKFEAYLLAHKRVSVNTFSAYKRDLAQFRLFLEEHKISLQELVTDTIRSFMRSLREQQLSPRSIARKLSAIKSFCTYLCSQGLFEHSPADKLAQPKIEKKLPVYLSEEEVEQLFAAAEVDTTDIGKRNRMLLYLLYVSGMRVSEVTRLRIADIQFDSGTMCIEGKGGRQRLIPLPEVARGMLVEYIEQHLKPALPSKNSGKNDWLFPTPHLRNKPITRQALWVIVKRLCKQAGIMRAISPHKLRHSFATHLLKKGANLRSLQLLLGHENLSTVQIYTHIETSYVRKVYDKKHPRS